MRQLFLCLAQTMIQTNQVHDPNFKHSLNIP